MSALRLAVAFLTRLPAWSDRIGPRDFGPAVAWFSAVGAALGLGLWGLWSLLHGHAAPTLAAALIVAALAWATAGLHLDGVADVCDALGAASKLEPGKAGARMLEVMRDSRVGALGALGLALALAIKIAAIAELRDPRLLVLAPAAARALPGLCMVGWGYARPSGLGSAFHQAVRRWHAGLGLLPVLALVIWTGAWLPALAALGAGLILAARLNRHLGGLTGDVYGAAIELGEIAAFVAAALLDPEGPVSTAR